MLLDGHHLPASGRSPVQLINQHPEHAINPRWRMRKVLEEAGQLGTTCSTSPPGETWVWSSSPTTVTWPSGWWICEI